jgi:rubrerythrin
MNGDEAELRSLLTESQDLQSDAIHRSGSALEDLTDIGQEQGVHPDPFEREENLSFAQEHRRAVAKSLSGATLLGIAGGGALVGLLASDAFASSKPDVQILQTAAAIEVLAVSTYKTALTLPYIGGSTANPVVKAFAQTTMAQHAQHEQAFNAAVSRLGGKKQTKPDPAFVPVVKKAVASLGGATAAQGSLGVVALALELENIAAETYVNDCAHLTDAKAKATTASIMGVEAQHVSVLLAVQALLMAGAPQLITLSPTNVASLPGVAGSLGFPNAFFKTNSAAPAKQGVVK